MAGRSKEMTATFDSGQGNTLKIPLPPVEQTPKILEAYWCNKDETKTTLLPHKEQAHVLIKAQNLDGKKVKIKVFEFDTGESNDDFIHEYEWTYSGDNMVYSLSVAASMFVRGEEDLAHFYFTLSIEDADPVPFCNGDGQRLKIHLVRYVPGVMTALGWDTGSALQDEWFSRESNDDPDSTDPNLSIVTMDWALGFSPAKDVYDEMISDKMWITPNGKKALIKEIKRMATDGKLIIPTEEGGSAAFGVFDKNIVSHDGGRIPTFDKYHYQESAYIRGFFSNVFTSNTDLTAALANFVFRMSAGGTLTKTATGYTVHITKVAVYIRDSFDFIDEDTSDSQTLGYWKIEENKVSKTSGSGYRHIQNISYRNYQDEFDLGGDFRLFSDIKYTNVDDSFSVPTV